MTPPIVSFALLLLSSAVPTQTAQVTTHVVVPQRRAFPVVPGAGTIAIERVAARITIVEQVATTRLLVSLRNTGAAPANAELVLPVPASAALRSFDFEGTSVASTARLLPRDDARAIYDEIVRQVRDPARDGPPS